MKLQVHTTLAPRSAIGALTVRVAQVLAGSHEVVIVAPKVLGEAEVGLPVLRHAAGPDYFPIYSIGAHVWFKPAFRALRDNPGLTILHDLFLIDLVEAALDLSVLDAHLTTVYGRGTADLLDQVLHAPNPGGLVWRLREAAPCTELVAAASLGVVTHSRWAAQRMVAQCLGRTTAIPLPAVVGSGPAVVPDVVADVRSRFDRVVVSVGHVNRNRCTEALLQAVSETPDTAGRVAVVLAGECDSGYEAALRRLAAGLANPVEVVFTGRIPDDQLRGVLGAADACAALRQPVLEAASASVLDQMASGKPVVVLDHGHFAELPRDCVFHVPAEGSPTALGRALGEALFSDGGPETGARGKAHVESVHTDAHYVQRLEEAILEAEAARPIFDMLTKVQANLGRLGVSGEEGLRDPLMRSAFELFGGFGGVPQRR